MLRACIANKAETHPLPPLPPMDSTGRFSTSLWEPDKWGGNRFWWR